MSLEDYRAALRALSCQPEPRRYCVDVEPSPTPPPCTSSGVIGRRARCSLERFGRLVVTSRDVPLRPPLPPGQVYDPYKQTIVFLGTGLEIRDHAIRTNCETGIRTASGLQSTETLLATIHLTPELTIMQTVDSFDSIDCGDPISYKLPASHSAVPELLWSEPRQLEVAPFCRRTFEKLSMLR
ncbi:hypothetical protein EVAR_75275_1 [Eumeta japonica]|uniref:Uncharacterized protein n=1 Tax=Eumeta variegata TaxID=151549 RepID=A0A4C1V9I2_EUMVA|nr:hypothetical protein EVAR_75275_1 [Eumeta japonica]